MGVPMGPIGMLAGVVLGGVGALCVGLIHDTKRVRLLRNELGLRIQHLEHLMRWIEFVFAQSEHPGLMLLYLCREFEPLFEQHSGRSRTKSALIDDLAAFLRRDDVQSVATQYLETFFSDWRKTGPDDIAAFNCVLTVCTGAFSFEKRPPAVYESMKELRQNGAVKRLLDSAQRQHTGSNRNWLLALDEDELKNTTVDHLFRSNFESKFNLGRFKRALSATQTSETTSHLIEGDLSGSIPLAKKWSTRYTKTAPVDAPIPWINELAVSRAEEQAQLIRRTSERGLAAPEYRQPVDEISWDEMPSVPAASHAVAVAIEVDPTNLAAVDVSLRRSCSLGGEVIGPIVAQIEHPCKQARKEGGPSELDPRPILPGEEEAENEEKPEATPLPSQPPAPEVEVRTDTDAVPSSLPVQETLKAFQGEQAPTSPKHSGSRDRQVAPVPLKDPVVPPPPPPPMVSKVRIKTPTPPPPICKPLAPKKFFKNFADFKDFDPELKHKIPIQTSEFELLDEFLPERPLGPWQLAVDKGTTRIYKQIVTVGGSDLVMVKGYALFVNQTIECMIYNLRDLGRRTAWDKTFDGFTLVEADVSGNEIVYNSIKAPWPVADREFLQWRRMEYVTESNEHKFDGDVGAKELVNGTSPIKQCRIMHRSAEHPGYPMPKTGANVVRAESVISAYVFTKTARGDVNVMLLTQCDIKGVVPKWLVNAHAAKAPVQWVENFRKACDDTKKMLGNRPVPKYTPKPQFTNAIRVMDLAMVSRSVSVNRKV